uniref:Uncharacterized protein n=1 Tax=Physcomitrium patens TaxID=3218 RepID=A0A2K1K6A8_PHYPA|nr:hypothetical protein PHYPA_011209 [Physcomitrium patens]
MVGLCLVKETLPAVLFRCLNYFAPDSVSSTLKVTTKFGLFFFQWSNVNQAQFILLNTKNPELKSSKKWTQNWNEAVFRDARC